MSFPAVNPVTASSKLWFIGESTTGNGGTPLQVASKIWGAQKALRQPSPAPGAVGASASNALSNNISTIMQPGPWAAQAIMNGYAGNTTDMWLTNYATRVATLPVGWTPTHVFIWMGVNDNGVYDGPTYVTKMTALVNDVLTSFPSTQVTLVSQLFNGEVWQTGPVWGGNAQDANIAIQETSKQTVCTNLNLPYIDIRTPCLTWEVTNNPSKNATALSGDGIHPTVAGGQVTAAGFWYPSLTVS